MSKLSAYAGGIIRKEENQPFDSMVYHFKFQRNYQMIYS